MWQSLVFHPGAMNETILVGFAEPGLATQRFLGGAVHGASFVRFMSGIVG
jgi:hypothetical protein